ncbi:MAG: hypothetical protein ACFHU9_12125 [Fluviicola sp.]
MSNINFIQHHNHVTQGRSVYSNPLKKYLRKGYFKAEPRTVLYWVAFIKEISKQKNIESYGYFWNDLLPPNLTNELIAEYIEDPRGTIADNRFTDEEIHELRQPQRILLFYFIKKLSYYFQENEALIENVNMEIAENIFRLYPKAAVPDKGYIILGSDDDEVIAINKGMLLDCVVEGEQVTRVYETATELYCNPLQLDAFWMATPVPKENHLVVVEQILPLEQTIYPFRPDQEYASDEQTRLFYAPSLIISSTLLCLRQGLRVINLKLKVDVEEAYRNDFLFEITTAEGWMSLPSENTAVETIWEDDTMNVQITIDPECQPITPLNQPSDEEAYLNNHSAILMELSVEKEAHFKVSEIDMNVEVCGLYPEVIRNQEQVLSVDDDYQPFGVDAELQSVFTFSHRELTHPQLQSIQLYPGWVAVPGDLDEYYKAYGYAQSGFQANIFTAIKKQDAVNPVVTENTTVELFDNEISFIPTTVEGVNSTCSNWDEDALDPLDHAVYYQLQLTNQDFGQSEYPLLITNYAIEYGVYENSWFKIFKKKPPAVNRPYIPLWSALKVDYSSENVKWTPEDKGSIIEVFKNEPIGYNDYNGEEIGRGIDQYGALYFGFKEVSFGQMATMLLHGETGNPRNRNVRTTWWYLREDAWVELTDFILDDKSHGFTQTGIFSFTVPQDMDDQNPMMPTDYYWLKLTIEPLWDEPFPLPPCRNQKRGYPDSLMTLDGIFTNAVSIIRNEEELEESNELTPLEAGSVLTFNDTALDYTIDLPYNTYGEVAPESNLDFWVRAFSHVRNKGRLVTENDYDDILLRDNRELSLVKAIPRWVERDYFMVVAISRQVYDTVPYNNPPILSRFELEQLRQQCNRLSSPFIGNVSVPPNIISPLDVKVINPCYSPIGFKLYLEFEEGSTFTDNKLNLFEDLQRFVNPWRYEKYVALEFGCWFDYSSILTYVQNLTYVKAVYEIELGFVVAGELTFPEKYWFQQDEILVLNSSDYIVVDGGEMPVECDGIGEMIINETFVVCDSNCSDDGSEKESEERNNKNRSIDENSKGSSDDATEED